VGDKGILSKRVLEELEEAEYEYIVASKLMKLPATYHEKILDKSGYRRINDDLLVNEMEVDGRRIVLGHSEKRAQRDGKMRQMLLERLQKRMAADPKGSLTKSAYKKYLTFGEFDAEIDMEKVEVQSRWDGHFGFVTNNENLTGEEVMGAYKLLWQIEESFRCMKSTLDLRPVYHWTPQRIEGHIMLCFLSFYVLRVIQKQLAHAGIDLSPERIMESLDEIRGVEIRTENRTILARTAIENQNNLILRALGAKIPHFILDESVVG
jgi:transposase